MLSRRLNGVDYGYPFGGGVDANPMTYEAIY